jgi:hypothetical protein
LDKHACRACRSPEGDVVLDLGNQPASDYFPSIDTRDADQVYPLAMWLCRSCGLAQLVSDPTVAEEPRGIEPAALVEQAADAVGRVADAGLLAGGARVAEYGSPHGGSWLDLLTARGLIPVAGPGPADVIIDCFGMMHAADQSAALAERAARLAPGGLLLLQYHSLDTIVRDAQWNALRHGHYAYYSTAALTAMLAAAGFSPRTAWQFQLYGGTILLAAKRDRDEPGEPDGAVRALLTAEARSRIAEPAAVRGLQEAARVHADGLRDWLRSAKSAGRTVLGYGAASRAVALLHMANIDRDLLEAVVDASPAKQGRRMPGTQIPIVAPSALKEQRPDAVLVFVPDLMSEVSVAYPEVQANGGQWVDAAMAR